MIWSDFRGGLHFGLARIGGAVHEFGTYLTPGVARAVARRFLIHHKTLTPTRKQACR